MTSVTNAILLEKIKFLEQKISDNSAAIDALTRTLRGFNGTPGIVSITEQVREWIVATNSRLAEIERRNTELEERVEQISKSVGEISGDLRRIEGVVVKLDAFARQPEESDSITFRWLVEKVVLPIVLPIVGGAAAYYLATKGF